MGRWGVVVMEEGGHLDSSQRCCSRRADDFCVPRVVTEISHRAQSCWLCRGCSHERVALG